MRTLLALDLNSAGQAVMECPPGKKVKLRSVFAAFAPGVEGDSIEIQFRQGSAFKAEAVSNPLALAITSVHASLGGPLTEPMLDKIDPVTGLATYKQTSLVASMPLPDIAWPWTIGVEVALPNGTVTQGFLLYEVEDEG